jgi:hypothetical protein
VGVADQSALSQRPVAIGVVASAKVVVAGFGVALEYFGGKTLADLEGEEWC